MADLPTTRLSLLIVASAGLCSALTAPRLIGQDLQRSAVQSVLDAAQRRIEDRSDIWEDHSRWENAWEVETDDVLVKTTKSYGFAKTVATGQQSMIEWFRRILGDGAGLGGKLVVHVWPDRTSYNAAGEEFGADHSSFYGSFLATRPEGPVVESVWDPVPEWDQAANVTLCQMQITHSLLHGYVARCYPSSVLPTWAVEGLAEYFAFYWNKPWAMRRLQALRDGGSRIGVRDLLVESESDFNDSRAQARMLTLGMLFLWLMEHRDGSKLEPLVEGEDASGPFRDFLVTGLRGRDMEEHPFRDQLRDPNELATEFGAWTLPGSGR